MKSLKITLTLLTILTSTASWAKDNIIILHGIARSSSHMEPVATFLESHKYQVYNLDYPSTSHTIEELIDLTQNKIESILSNHENTIHFIGYSMGGLLVRGLLTKYRYPTLGKVILLGTPNHGSEVANTLKNNVLYKFFYGPAGQQLTTNSLSISKLYGSPYYNLGIIAGNFTIDPISSWIIPGDDDGKVSIQSTKLNGMTDHTTLSTSHTFMPSNTQVHHEILHFLKHNHFSQSNSKHP